MPTPKRIADDLAVTAQPDKSDIARLAELGYRTLINNRPDGEEPGQLSAAEARAEAGRVGMKYVHIPVKASEIGALDVEAFRRALQESPKPIVGHCKSGTRSYLLWGAGEVLDGKGEAGAIAKQAAADGYDLKSLPDLVQRLAR